MHDKKNIYAGFDEEKKGRMTPLTRLRMAGDIRFSNSLVPSKAQLLLLRLSN